MNATEARDLRRASALSRVIARNDALIRNAALGSGPKATQLFYLDDETGLDVRAEVQRHYATRGFDVSWTHGGVGLRASF